MLNISGVEAKTEDDSLRILNIKMKTAVGAHRLLLPITASCSSYTHAIDSVYILYNNIQYILFCVLGLFTSFLAQPFSYILL